MPKNEKKNASALLQRVSKGTTNVAMINSNKVGVKMEADFMKALR